MDRREKREIARKIAKAEKRKDYEFLDEYISSLSLSLEDLCWIDEEILKIYSTEHPLI